MKPKLTSSMKQTLRDIFRGVRRKGLHRRTVEALQRRGLLNEHADLTDEGRLSALELVPLREQCDHLHLPITDLTLTRKSEPEIDAWRYFKANGYLVSFCEGGPILILIRAACLDTLTFLNISKSREDACQRFTEAQLTILKDRQHEILAAYENSSRKVVETHFEEIYSYPLVKEFYPGLDSVFMGELYECLGVEKMKRVIEKLMESSYELRNGWPDLTLIKSGDVEFLEVKTTDKLHRSQLITIPIMRAILHCNFGVARLLPEK